MRTLSDTLLAAQKSASRNPYVVVEYYSDGSWVSLTSAVLAATHLQEDYHSGLSVLINNRTNAYKDLSIRGKPIRIGHGFVTAEGNEYSFAPTLWVDECGPNTRPGHNEVIIKALGIWDRLANSYPAEEVTYNESSDTDTIKAIISDILYRATGEYLGTDISIDSIVNTRYVKYTLSLDLTYAEHIIQLLSNTECELLPRGSQLCLIHPQDDDSVTYTYDAGHVISANTRRVALFKPNKVTVLSVQSDGSQVSGTYADPETGSLMTYEAYKYTSHYWGVTSQAICEALAEDFVQRMKRRGNKGEALTKINCGQELWDVVSLTDKWTGQTFTARVGRIEVNYSKSNDQGYMMRLGFGAWTENNEATDGGEVATASDFIPGISGEFLSPYSIEPWVLRKYMQPYTCTVAPDKANASYTWEVVYWLAGDVHFADGTKLPINAGNLDLTSAGYGDNPVLLYFKEGKATLQHTSNWMTAMAPGCGVVAVVQRAESEAGKVSWDASNGKAGVLNTRLLLADMILANHIKAGELVLGGKVTGNLDNVGEGSDYKRMPATWISAGKLLLAGLADETLDRMFDTKAKSDKIQAWCHSSDATYIDGGKIYTGTVALNKLTAFPSQLMDGYQSSFEVWTTSPGPPDGWEAGAGLSTAWGCATANPKHGSNYAAVAGGSEVRGIRWKLPIYCDENDIITITAWLAQDSGADGSAAIGFDAYNKSGGYIGTYSNTWVYSAFTAGNWYERSVTLKCPSGTCYIKPVVYIGPDNTTGYWYFDDVRGNKSAVVIVHGTIGGARVIIGPDPSDPSKFGIYGMSDSTTKQFYLEAATGKAVAGGGNVVIDATGIHIKDDDLDFYNGTTLAGRVWANGPTMHLDSYTGGILLSPASGNYVTVSRGLYCANATFIPMRTSQSSEPTLAEGEMRIWRDSDDGKVYLVYNDEDSGQKKVELT